MFANGTELAIHGLPRRLGLPAMTLHRHREARRVVAIQGFGQAVFDWAAASLRSSQ
jgi:hypothetical protein